jgi:dipeptidyl aminopeptidase/acylaminoacyl peptidase
MGIGTLRIDFRGSGDSEGDFSEMTLEGEISDALKALQFLSEHSQIDKHRLGIMGRSLGGAVAVMAASRFQSVKSLCLWAPIYSSHPWHEKWQLLHSEDVHEEHKDRLMTVEGQKPSLEFFKQFFAMSLDDYMPGLQETPLFLIHGSKDQVVTPSHSEKYLQTRLSATGETKFIELPQSDHDFSILRERLLALEETCVWFTKTL